MLAGKISLAVRRDVFTKSFDENAFNDFIEKVEEIEKITLFQQKLPKNETKKKANLKIKREKAKKERKGDKK